MNARGLLKDNDFHLRLRMRIEDAVRDNRDVARAALDAIREHVDREEPSVMKILHRTKRVQVIRGTENTYIIHMAAADDERDVREITLTQAQFHREPHVFLEKMLAEFHENILLDKKEWPDITNEWLQPTLLQVLDGQEVVNEELSAMENFRDHILVSWQATRNTKDAVEQDRALLSDDGETVLIRGERIERWLTSRGYKIKLNDFARELKRQGWLVETSVQKKVGESGVEAKRVLRFWRFKNIWSFSDAVLPPAVEGDLPIPPPMPTSMSDVEGAEEGR